MKTKTCATCGEAHTTCYRVQTQKGKVWIFVCKACCEAHRKGDYYRYGGTWQSYRH